jgi:mono/diheme cytochrome c family protein
VNSLFDLLLLRPVNQEFLRVLLFVSFSLHLTFVLLAIGTAVISLYYFVRGWREETKGELRWDKKVLRTFMAHKSLAVVLGVAPLLLIQVGFSLPFFTSVTLLAPFWMALVLLLIIAFLSFDILGHRIFVHPYLHLIFGVIGLACLLAVPATFVAILVVAENSDQWLAVIRGGYHLSGPLAVHWLFRYLHVLGAGIVLGGVFHYFFSARAKESRKKALLLWITTGLLLQVIIGLLLYQSLPNGAGRATNLFLFIGILAALVLLWIIFDWRNRDRSLGLGTVVPLLTLVVVPMLLARQALQDREFLPLEKEVRGRAGAYEKGLEAYVSESIKEYQSDLKIVYDRGEVIYSRSCAFCHGNSADGRGPEAANLAVAPEDLAALRAEKQALYGLIIRGVPGSAMPYFSVFERPKILGLIDYLNQNYGVLGLPGPLPVKIPDAARAQAKKTFDQTCSLCHGQDGRGSKQGRAFRPEVPDFTVYNLTPQRAFAVISKGYPGTVMPAFGQEPEDVRWGLVGIINSKRRPGPGREREAAEPAGKM